MGKKIMCYGGPLHGRWVDNSLVRFECRTEGYPERYYFEARHDFDVPPPAGSVVHYVRQTFAEQRYRPRRGRSIQIAMLEGASLSPIELVALNEQCQRQPWTIEEPKSFLGDTEQWLSHLVYRLTGELWWHNRKLEHYE